MKIQKLKKNLFTKHKTKRLFQRIGIKMTKLFNPLDHTRSEENTSERDASILFRKMITQKDSELLISPISSRYFVKNDSNNILIILTEYELIIINHVFGYNIKLSQKSHNLLYRSFVNEVESRRDEMEKNFSKNVKHSLQTLIKRIND